MSDLYSKEYQETTVRGSHVRPEAKPEIKPQAPMQTPNQKPKKKKGFLF